MRVVPTPDMIAYLNGIGALEQRARAAAVAPVSPAPARSPSASVRRRPEPPRLPSVRTELVRWIVGLWSRLIAGSRTVIRAIASAMTLLIVLASVNISAAQTQTDAESSVAAGRTEAARLSEAGAESLQEGSIEPVTPRLDRDLLPSVPIVIFVTEPDWRLLVAAIAGNGGLAILAVVLFVRSQVGRRVGAAIAGCSRRFPRRLSRKRARLPELPPDSPAQDQIPGLSVAAPFIYRSTLSMEDASDPLISCWLERLDAWVRLNGGRTLPNLAWSTDLRSHRGHVRSRNEDFGIGLQLHKLDIVLVADGCGGVPCGYQASRIAVCAAAVKLIDSLTGSADEAGRESAVRAAFAFAAEKLADAARIYASPDEGQSLLQTTLIIAVASTSWFTLGYIGDGGAVLVRPRDGTETHVLTPMKAEDGVPNVLAAVLGPQILGEPSVTTFERQPGDLLVMGTDGVWDFVPGSFSKQLVREIMLRRGHVGEALDAALDLLARHQDDLGHVCSDNLTLAVVAPGAERPRFGRGYWKVAAKGGPDPTMTTVHEQEEGVRC